VDQPDLRHAAHDHDDDHPSLHHDDHHDVVGG
jgi:hypothetical protein